VENVCVLCWGLFPFFVKKMKSHFLFMRIVVKDIQGIVRSMAVNCKKYGSELSQIKTDVLIFIIVYMNNEIKVRKLRFLLC